MCRTSPNTCVNDQLPFPLSSVNEAPKYWLLLRTLVITFLVIFIVNGVQAADNDDRVVTSIGVIIDANSSIGKEEKIAMEIAVQEFNSKSQHQILSLIIRDTQRDPLIAAKAAKELIEEKKVKVIVGMETWGEAALVADIGSRAQVLVLSFAAPAIRPPLASRRWPFLIRMANHDAAQMECIADLALSYRWKRVIVMYEDDTYGGDNGKFTLLSEALQNFGSEVEFLLVFPPFSLLSDPESYVHEELMKVLDLQSRVFIVLQSSLSLTTHLFREAKKMELMGRDTAWIVTDSVTSILNSVDSSVISSMEGTLGIMNYYHHNTSSYNNFYAQFRQSFRLEYPEDNDLYPGIHALRAYDGIRIISQALENVNDNSSNLLKNISGSNFTGLSGAMRFKAGELFSTPTLRIVNVVGKEYKELDFWNANFSEEIAKVLGKKVMWPGNLLGTVPKGWAMPTNATPMIIGVPNRTSFDKFVKFEANATEPVGFCIDLFYMVLAQLDYALPHKFVEHNYRGSYDDLVYKVYNKTYDAAVGDVTILANRTNYVDFAQPYAESGLSLIVPSKYEDSLWLFMKPFSIELWVVSGAIFIYTMLIVWFLEHRSNPEFRGPLKAQISSALWFTFSSVFFAHGERVYSHITRVVVIGWLFVVFILSSSYTASLSSLLTIRRLESNLDISSIQQRGLQVGVDDDSFIRNYLINVLNFKSENIKTFNRDSSYTSYFKNNSIAAAFLELPYEKLFLGQHCQEYTATTRTYRYGGLSFAFPKGSPFKADFSRAILNLSENGDLKKLEEKWLAPLRECSTNVTDSGVESLSLHSFWGIYLMCGATSAICVLLYLIHLLRTFLRLQQVHEASMTPSQKSVWKKTVRLARYLYYGEFEIPGRYPTMAQAPVIDEWGSSKWEYASPDEISENHHHISSPA